MLQVIQNYKEVMQNNNLQDLGQLISELDALRASLIARSESFGKQFDPAWATLEEVYAVLLDRDETHLDEIGQKLVSEAMGHIESLIRSEISTA
jgi:hypothetical protein